MGLTRKSEDKGTMDLNSIVVGSVHAQCDGDQIALV